MQKEHNASLIREVFEDALNLGKMEVIDVLFSRSFVDHSTHDQVPGPAGVKDYFAQVRHGFPDIHVIIDDLIATDDKVVVRTTWHGTHQGRYEGIEPTGRQVTRTMIQIFRIVDGKIQEEWNEGRGLLE
ncbi:MAG: hypothetical protein NVS4B12_28720 [Ktedonobacteraceae bacterium]